VNIEELIARAVVAAVRPVLAEALDEALASADLTALPPLVDRAGLARSLSCSVDTIDRLRAEGCPAVRVGDAWRFDVATVRRWLEQRGR
jgi:hypothetical protein